MFAGKVDLAEEKAVEDEEERTEHRSLGHTLVQGFSCQWDMNEGYILGLEARVLSKPF